MYGGTQVQQTGSDTKQRMLEASKGCSLYEGCPICHKCMNRASHLYLQCDDCDVPFCGHTHKHRSFIIRRENFGITVSDETGKAFQEAAEKVNACTCNTEGSST